MLANWKATGAGWAARSRREFDGADEGDGDDGDGRDGDGRLDGGCGGDAGGDAEDADGGDALNVGLGGDGGIIWDAPVEGFAGAVGLRRNCALTNARSLLGCELTCRRAGELEGH